jgi:uncharacterized membrane protein YhhN
VDALAVGLVALFVVLAVADWVVIWRGASAVRPFTKTSATVALVVVAAVAGDMAGDARVVLVLAVLLCLAGDIALLGPSDGRFLLGLTAFALGHVGYVVTALLVGVAWPRLAWAFPFLAVVLAVQSATKMIPGARRRGGTPMMVAVAVYSAVISAMVITATGTSSWLAAVGAMLFATSDLLIGVTRFAPQNPFPQGNRGRTAPDSLWKAGVGVEVAVMVTYHVGQLLLIGGLIVAG